MTKRPPRHFNPLPMFGLRVRLSRTAEAIFALIKWSDGITADRVAPMLCTADVISREYLGRPITDVQWTRQMLSAERP